MVISLVRMRKWWFWLKLIAILAVLAVILPPAIGWVRYLMSAAAGQGPGQSDVVTPPGEPYARPIGGLLGKLVEVLKRYYRRP